MQEPRTILVPVDFSTHSRAAAIRACDLALASGSTVRLIHALELPAVAKREGVAEHLWDDLRRSERRKLDELMGDLMHRGAPLSRLLEEREPVEMIEEQAASESVEMIVMGTHGYRGVDRMFLGSVAERTIRIAKVPVLTVKESDWDAAAKIRRILLATDFSQDSERAVGVTIEWARHLQADVEVFHAIQGAPREPEGESDATPTGDPNDSRERSLVGLQKILSQMLAAGVPASAELSYGPAAVEISKRAKHSRANLVIMGRHGTSRIRDVVCGSVSSRVLRQVKCSVLLVPDSDAS